MDPTTDPLRVTVFTALPVETQAVLEQLESFQPSLAGDTVELRGFLKNCVAACEITVVELGPGNIETAMEAGRIRSGGSAQVLLFVGIAGALKDLKLGDVVAAHEVVWLHRAKIENGERWTRAQVQPCTRELVQLARYTAGQGAWARRLTHSPVNPPSALVGQILSGEELVKDATYREELLREYSDAKAVENEGYGLVRAGAAALKVMVIRGASDHADKSKVDTSQPVAAKSAAAFAAQLLNDYLSLLVAPNIPAPREKQNSIEDTTTHSGAVSMAYDRAATLIDALRDDVDLLADDVADVRNFALTEFEASDPELRVAMVELLAAEVDDRSDTLAARRLREFGRAFVAEFGPDSVTVGWDLLLQRHPVGAAVIAAQEEVVKELTVVERRRMISALIGNAEEPREGTSISWRYLLDLLRGDCLAETEMQRLITAMHGTPYESLREAGFSIADLMPKLAADLQDHDFQAQNRAARFISSNNPLVDDGDLSVADQGKLAALLVRAAKHGSFGAKDATATSRMAEWPKATLAEALWTTITDGRRRLDAPSESLRDVLAAATLSGNLPEVLEATLEAVDPAELDAVSEDAAREDHQWLAGRASKLPEEAQSAWVDFVDRLYEKVPRNTEG